MRLGLLTCLWHDAGRDAARLRLSELVLSHYARTAPEALRLAVGSEGDLSRRLAERFGWCYVERPNQPLSDKWQHGLYALQGKVDAVVVVGSDDFLRPYWLRRVAYEVERGADVVELASVFFLNAQTGQMRHVIPEGQRFGLGRGLAAGFLDRIGWWLWPLDLSNGLDTRSERFALQRARRRVVVDDVWPAAPLDVKTSDDGHMWAWSVVAGHGTGQRIDARAFLARYYPHSGLAPPDTMRYGIALRSFAGIHGTFSPPQDPDNPHESEIYGVPDDVDYFDNGFMREVPSPGAPPPAGMSWVAADGSRFSTLKEARAAGWKRADLEKL